MPVLKPIMRNLSSSLSNGGTASIERGKWYTVDVQATIDSGAGNDGTIDLFATVEGGIPSSSGVITTPLTSQDQNVPDAVLLQVTSITANTTGTVLFGHLIVDSDRPFPLFRYPIGDSFAKSAHAFVGPGSIESAALLESETGDEVMRLWDTDNGTTTSSQDFIVELDAAREITKTGPVTFKRGCYVELSGTNPRGYVEMVQRRHDGFSAPRYYSDGTVRRWGASSRYA